MKKLLIPAVVAMLAITSGCKSDASKTASNSNASTTAQSTLSSTTSLSPEQLGALGAQIRKQPNDADKLLAEKGLTEESFAAAIRKVSENPADAKRYSAAYRSAS